MSDRPVYIGDKVQMVWPFEGEATLVDILYIKGRRRCFDVRTEHGGILGGLRRDDFRAA